jgi:hypothetical protein
VSKQLYQRQIDQQVSNGGGSENLASAQGAGAAPALPTPPAPIRLEIVGSPVPILGGITPTAGVNLRWIQPGNGLKPEGYQVQWARDAAFTSPTTREAGNGKTSAGLDGLPASMPDATITLWFRVRAVLRNVPSAWSNVVSAVMPVDLAPPASITLPQATWNAASDGDMILTWTNPLSRNFLRTRVRFYQSNGAGVVRYETFTTSPRFVLTRKMQQTQVAGGVRQSYLVVFDTFSSSGVQNTDSVSLLVNWVAPATPVVTADFSGTTAVFDAFIANAANLTYAWTITNALGAGSIPASYRTSSPRFELPLAENTRIFGGAPSPSLLYTCVAVDPLGFTSSPAASGTVTNPPPTATTIAAAGFFFTVRLTIAPSAATDLRDYRVRVYKAGVLVRTFFTAETSIVYQAEDGDGAYTFDVTVYDVFNQPSAASAQTAAQSVRDYSAYIALLREEATYSDSRGNDPATLKAALADDVTASGGSNYGGTTSWEWVQIFRELTYRYRPLTIGRFAMASGAAGFYVAMSGDGVAWRYFAAPVTLTNGVGVLTEVAGEAAAQTAAVGVTNVTATTRWELPVTVEARYVRLYVRQPTAAFTLREFYAETFIRADRIQAGGITALHIATGAVVADAIAAGAIDGKLITGATIRTAASGQRVELDSNGLRTYDSAGNVQVEATTSTNGALLAGQGQLRIDRDGMLINTPVGGAPGATNAIRFSFEGIEFGKLLAAGSIFGTTFGLFATAADTSPRLAELQAQNTSGAARLFVSASDGTYGTGAVLTVASGATTREIWRGRISGTTGQLSFFGGTPVAKQTLPAAATDDASERTLVNALRTLILNYGLA